MIEQMKEKMKTTDEVQFLKYFNDVWDVRVKQMMIIRGLFLYLDRTEAVQSGSMKQKQQHSVTTMKDPNSPLESTNSTTNQQQQHKQTQKLPLWELSVQQFQTKIDENIEVIRKASSGCLRLIDKEREGERVDRQLIKKFTTALETLKRYSSSSSSSFATSLALFSNIKRAPTKNTKKRSINSEEEDDNDAMMTETTATLSNNNNNNNNTFFEFERLFLENSAIYYARESDKRFSNGSTTNSVEECASYLKHCECRLREEILDRAETYLQPQTKLALTKCVVMALIDHKKSELIEAAYEMLADRKRIDDTRRLYSLLSRVDNGVRHLRDQFVKRLKYVGTKTVQDEDVDCIEVLLDMKSAADDIVTNAFDNQKQFSEGAKDAFEQFINNSKNNRIAELIAKFMDEKLKKGAHKRMDTEADLDMQLNRAVNLFRFIQGKDVFEAFYKKDLAKRLLLSKSASIDAERLVVGKLKAECGANFTKGLEGMFRDVDVSRDIVQSYRKFDPVSVDFATTTSTKNNNDNGGDVDMTTAVVVENNHKEKDSKEKEKSKKGASVAAAAETTTTSTDSTNRENFSVNILTAGCWPTSQILDCTLPPELSSMKESFEQFYLERNAGRQLMWQHSTSTCVLKVKFDIGTKELQVSLAQAVCILAFNEDDKEQEIINSNNNETSYTYKELKGITKIPDVELKRTLQSLYGGKYRVLCKAPASKEIDEVKDKFSFNFALQEKLVRLKISAIQSAKERSLKDGENEAVRERVQADRHHQIDAMIVRILKTKKSCQHAVLVNETIQKLNFPVQNQDLKKRIENLIEREYVERDKEDSTIYHYLA